MWWEMQSCRHAEKREVSSGKCQPRNSRLPNLVATGFGNFLCMFVLKKHCSARFLITSRHSASRAHFADVLIAHPLPTRFFSDRKKNVSQCTGVKQWIGSGFTALFLPPNFPNPCRRFSTVLLHPHRGMGNTSSHRQPSPPAAAASASAPVPSPTHVPAEASTSRHSPLGQQHGDVAADCGMEADEQYASPVCCPKFVMAVPHACSFWCPSCCLARLCRAAGRARFSRGTPYGRWERCVRYLSVLLRHVC